MPSPDLTRPQLEEGVRSLYRDPVAATEASAHWCVDFAGLHYPPRAVVLRATQILGRPLPAALSEEAAVAVLRAAGVEVADCTDRDGAPCGGIAGLEPPADDRYGFGAPYEG